MSKAALINDERPHLPMTSYLTILQGISQSLFVLLLILFYLDIKQIGQGRAFVGAIVAIGERMTRWIQSALPLPKRTLLALLLCVTVVLYGAAIYKQGWGFLAYDGVVQDFDPNRLNPLSWIAIGVGQLLLYWLSLCLTTVTYRLWAGKRNQYGFVSDVVDLLPLGLVPKSWPIALQYCVVLVAMSAVMVVGHLVSKGEALSPVLLLTLQTIQEGSVGSEFMSWPFIAKSLLMAATAIGGTFARLSAWLFWAIIISILSTFTRNQMMALFANDAIRTLQGPIPEIAIGPFRVGSILAYFALTLISSITMFVVLFAAGMLNGLVTTL